MAANLSWQIPLSDVNNTFAVTLISDQVLTGVTLDDFIFRPVGESTIEANSVATLTNVAGTNNWRLDVTLTGTYDTDFVVRLRPNRVTDADGDSNARLDSNAFRVDSSLTAPDAPTNLSITPSETTAAGSFDASANDGGLAVTDHEYAIEAGSSLSASPTWVSTGSTGTSFTIPSLVADTEYTAAVRAVNSIGESDASDSVTFTTTAAATVVTGYQIQVYDKNYKTQSGTDGTLARTLTHAVSIRIERDLNRPEKITFQVPRKGDDADAIEFGKVVRVINGSDIVASGEIVGPLDKTRPFITVNVLGKALRLSYGILPWDFKLEGSTAEAQVRELLKNYRFFRQNTEDDFNDGAHVNTEVTTIADSTSINALYYFVTEMTVTSVPPGTDPLSIEFSVGDEDFERGFRRTPGVSALASLAPEVAQGLVKNNELVASDSGDVFASLNAGETIAVGDTAQVAIVFQVSSDLDATDSVSFQSDHASFSPATGTLSTSSDNTFYYFVTEMTVTSVPPGTDPLSIEFSVGDEDFERGFRRTPGVSALASLAPEVAQGLVKNNELVASDSGDVFASLNAGETIAVGDTAQVAIVFQVSSDLDATDSVSFQSDHASFSPATGTLNLDGEIPSDSYYITLTKTGEDYNASGTFISQPILCTDPTLGSPTGFTRLRYVARLGNDTDIKVEFRHSNDAATTAADSVSNWSLWSSEYDTSSDSETQQQLGITGYSIIADFRWVQVRFTLTTSDVTITPALQAFEVVAEYPSEITAGSISLAGDALDETFSFKSHLSAIQRIVAARNAEFRVNDDYTLDVKERFGVTSPTVTYTVHSNCEVIRFQQQDRRLSTEIWSLGSAGQGLTQPFESSASESATEAYGSRPWIYTPNATTEIARTQEIADELALRDTPTNTVVIEETDTTESIEVGDLVSFEYTERSIDTTLRVITITVADPRLGTPRQIELISDEGFFASQADAIEGVTAPVTEGTTGTDAEDLDILEWYWFQPVDVNSNSSGEFSGVVLPGVEGNLNNPSGATVTLTVASRSSSLTSASINADGDLNIAFTGLAGNLAASVTIEAEATVGGVVRTAPVDIDLNLVYPPDAESVTEGDISAFGFITAGDPAIPDVSSFITAGDVPSTAGFITTGDLTTATMGFITIGDVPDAADTSLFLTSGDLPDVSAYITIGDVTGLGYITTGDLPDVSAYITIGDVTGLGYITTGDLPDVSAYITIGDVTGLGYITTGDLPDVSAYITIGDVTGLGYITTGDLTAATASSVTTGDLTAATASSVTTGDLTAATASSVTTGDLTAATASSVSAGDLTAATMALVSTGDLTAATMSFITAGDVPAAPDLSTYVTDGDLTAATMSFITAGSSAIPDVSDFITAGDSAIPDVSDFVTDGDLPDVSDFVTAGAMCHQLPGFVTEGDLPDVSDFITLGDVTGLGYITTGDLTAATAWHWFQQAI